MAKFDEVCTVPCKPMDEKLESVWEGIKEKVNWRVFALVISGLGGVGVLVIGIMIAMVSHNQDAIGDNQKAISKSFSELKADVRVQTSQMAEVQSDVKEIRRELRRYNGGSRRRGNPNP